MLERISGPSPRLFAAVSDHYKNPVVIAADDTHWPVLFDAELDRLASGSAGGDDLTTVDAATRVSRHRSHATLHQVVGESQVALFPGSAITGRHGRHRLRSVVDTARTADHHSSPIDLVNELQLAVGLEPHSVTLLAGDTLFVPRRWWIAHHRSADSWTVRSYWQPRRRRECLLGFLGLADDPTHSADRPAPLRDGFNLPRHDAG